MEESAGLALARHFDSEEEEVRLAIARDPAVWALWYDRHYTTLFRYAFARLGNRQDAEDVASQAFLRALNAIDTYRHRGRPVLAWLYTIARNLTADKLRSSSNRVTSLDAAPPADVSLSSVEDQLDGIQLRQALTRLKQEQREVIILRFLLSFSLREAARLLGKSEAAVHSLQVRAIQALRRQLER